MAAPARDGGGAEQLDGIASDGSHRALPRTRRAGQGPLRSRADARASPGEPLLAARRDVAEPDRPNTQIRKCHAELLDYNPPIRLLTLLESLRSSSDPLADLPAPDWPFKRSSLSSIGMDLTPEELAEREEILNMSDAAKSKALVQVLKSENELEGLMTPKGFLLTGPPGTGKSLLMDIFFQSLPIPHKVRYHYHQYACSPFLVVLC